MTNVLYHFLNCFMPVIYSYIAKNHKHHFLQSVKVVHHKNCAFNSITRIFSDNIHKHNMKSSLMSDMFRWVRNLFVCTRSVKVKRTLYKSSPYQRFVRNKKYRKKIFAPGPKNCSLILCGQPLRFSFSRLFSHNCGQARVQF